MLFSQNTSCKKAEQARGPSITKEVAERLKVKTKKLKYSCNGKYYLPVSLNTVSIQKENIK
jgi:hypothetical protein